RRIVEGRQRLQGSVGADAPRSAELAAGRVEGGQARVWRGAADEGIDAASVTILVLALDPLHVAVGPVPDAGGLIRKDARAADFGAQQAAHCQVNVSHHLGLNAEARAASQKL